MEDKSNETKTEQQEVLKISKEDLIELNLIKLNVEKLSAEAKLALSLADNEQLKYKLAVTQLFLKYKLDADDKINQDGSIIKTK